MKNSTLKQVFRLLASGRCRAGSSDARTLLHLPRPPFAFAQWAAVAQLPVSSSSSPRSRSRVHWSGRPGEETNTHKTVKRWPISVRVIMFYFHVPKFVLIFPMTSHPILLSYLFSINIRRAKSYYPFEDFFFFPPSHGNDITGQRMTQHCHRSLHVCFHNHSACSHLPNHRHGRVKCAWDGSLESKCDRVIPLPEVIMQPALGLAVAWPQTVAAWLLCKARAQTKRPRDPFRENGH